MMDECYDYSITPYMDYLAQANIDRRFANGDQRTMWGTDGQAYQNQKFIFSLLHSFKQQILGHQRKNRKSSIVVPIEDRDQQTADDYSGCLIWTMRVAEMLNKISDAYNVSITQGLCFTQVWKDFSREPIDGDLKLRNYAPGSMIFDPYWREPDLSDCRYIWFRDYFSLEQLKYLVPGLEDEVSKIPRTYNNSIRFTFMPEAYQIKSRNKNNYAYDQFYYLTDRQAEFVHSYDRSETYEFKGDKKSRDMWIQMTFSPEERENIEIIKKRVPAVNLAISINDYVVYDEYYADEYNVAPCLAYFDPDSTTYAYRFFGIIRPARDMQYLFNRRMETQFQILESLVTSGIDVVEDALINKDDAFKTGPGQVRVIKKGYVPGQAIQNIQPPAIDASAMKMTDDLPTLMMKSIGLNEEIMGMADDSKAGITEMLRQGASLTSLQTLFDNLDLYQRTLSKKLLGEIQEYSESKVERILGRKPTEEFYNLSFKKFDCQIEDGLNTSTQKQMQFAQLLSLIKEAGLQVSQQMLIKSSTLQNKQDLIQDVQQQQQQAQQMAQMQQQSELMVAQANANLLQSQARANDATANERNSRVAENQQLAVANYAKAENEEAMAILHQVEAIQKLKGIDLQQIQQSLELLESLKAIVSSDKEEVLETQQQQEVGYG